MGLLRLAISLAALWYPGSGQAEPSVRSIDVVFCQPPAPKALAHPYADVRFVYLLFVDSEGKVVDV